MFITVVALIRGERADELLGHTLSILCGRLRDLNCDLFQPSEDANLRSRWMDSGVFAETRSTFFRCCHMRQGNLNLKFPDSNLTSLIPTPGGADEEYIANFARNFRGAYLDVGSGSEAAICRHAEFPGMGVSVEPVHFLAEKIPSDCPHVRALIGNHEGETNFFEINFQALQALYGEEAVPKWMAETSTPLSIFRVLSENAITREVGTFVEDLFYERRSEMTTIRSILELANISDRKLLLRVRAGGLEPVIMDEILEINPEIFILEHEYMELLDLAKILEDVRGPCAMSLKYLFCTSDEKIFDAVFFDTRSLLRTLDI